MATAWKKIRYGCLGLVTVLLVAVLVMSGLAVFTAQPEQVEDRVLTPEIPATAAGGRVVLDIREAEIRIEPAGPGERLRVEAHYDVATFAIEEEFQPPADAGKGWVYRMTFGRGDRAGAFSGIVSLVRGSTARIHVFLPADIPLDIELDANECGAVVRLGGLWLQTGRFEFESGAFELDIHEPLREPMESLAIRTERGGSLLNNIGNASPRRFDVSYSIGGIDMGLAGNWVTDSDISISGGMGGGAVHLPSGVVMEGLENERIETPAVIDPDQPTLRFTVTTGLGRLEFSG